MAHSRTLPIYGGLDGGPRPGARDAVAAALRAGVDAVTVADHVARGVDAISTEVLALDLPGEPRPACSKGCFHCCHVRVELTAPEVFLLARALDGAGPARMRRISENEEKARDKDGEAYLAARIRCALLDESGACSVYEARPLACRRAHSSSVDACLASYGDSPVETIIPSSEALSFHTSAIVIGYYEGSVLGERPPHHYELHAALRLALVDAEASARFARGEEPFPEARARDASDLFGVLGRAETPEAGQ